MDVVENLKERYLDTNLHRVWVDECEGVATFPILNLSWQMVGYQQYRPSADKKKKNHPKEGRYFTYTKKDSRGVWGLESWYQSSVLFVTEGIFDAARLTSQGQSAIAVLSNDPEHLRDWLYMIRSNRKLVAVCDSGTGGKRLAKYAHEHVTVQDGDLGSSSEKYVEHLIKMYS